MSAAASGGGGGGGYTTRFNAHDLGQLKGMLNGTSPDKVREVAGHWTAVHDALVGSGDGGGGLQKQFNDAVAKVLETWHGDTADRFKEAADKISTSFEQGAPFATHAATTLYSVSGDLQDTKQKIDDIDDGWNWGDDVWHSMPWEDQIDDSDLNSALASGADTQALLDQNEDKLSGHQKNRLKAAVAMQNLGTNYVSQASALKIYSGGYDHKHDESGAPAGGDGSNIVTPPMGGGVGGPSGGGASLRLPSRGQGSGSSARTPASPKLTMPTAPRDPGISGGTGQIKAPKSPSVSTGLDGLGAPTGGTGGTGGSSLTSGGGGSAGADIPSTGGLVRGGGPGPGVGGSLTGVTGLPKSGSGTGGSSLRTGSGISGTGGAGGAAGTAASRGMAGRSGMPGMGGAAGKGGLRPGGTGGAGGSSLARQRGGVVGGSAAGRVSEGTQGGSGLHRSRGGTATGETGSGAAGRRPAGMMGGHGARGKGENKGHEESDRPDYLIEEEETWTPERDIAPPVIE